MTDSVVRVGVRVRPLLAKEKNDNMAEIAYDQHSIKFRNQTFTFDHVFGSSLSQAELYRNTAAPMLKSFLEGYNVTIMAYGQTGSGKTYTMGTCDSPTADNDDEQGLIPRFICDLFDNIYHSDDDSNRNISAKVFDCTCTCQNFIFLYFVFVDRSFIPGDIWRRHLRSFI